MALCAALAMVATACWGGGGSDDAGPTTVADSVPGGGTAPTNIPTVDTPGLVSGAVDSGVAHLGLRLSEGVATERAVEPVRVVDGVPLTDAEITTVLDRLPEWDVPPTDVKEFNRPPESLGPPLVGDTVDAPFPPAPDAPSVPNATADGPLEVLRIQPDGEIDVAPFLSVTFNEPMVPLATLEQLDVADVPAVITPSLDDLGVDGRWRWIGTRTLRFEVIPGDIDRLPAATEYTIEIPEGTTSANGAVLAEGFTWTFATPPPEVLGVAGLGDSMDLDPVFVATFDQRVEPTAILDVIRFEAGDVDGVRLATDAEVEADPVAQRALDHALPERAVAFVPTSTLAPDTNVTIDIGPGVPSLEGPRTNPAEDTFDGETYGPLKLDREQCGGGNLVPYQPFNIRFSNELDADAFRAEYVRIEPALPGFRVEVVGRSLELQGATAGNTDYTVTLSGDIQDTFGQTLGQEIAVRCRVGPAEPFLIGPSQRFVTTDPFVEAPGLTYTTVNHDDLRVTAWQVSPEQYGEYVRHLEQYYSDTRPPDPDWPVVLDTEVAIDADPDVVVETVVDLTAAFEASNGPIVVRTEVIPAPGPRDDDFWRNQPVLTWVQQTTLGVDAFVGEDELLIWTTDLLTGDPVGDVDVRLLGANRTVTTDADGLARTELSSSAITGLVATVGDRSAMLATPFSDGWKQRTRNKESRWYVTDDRGVYRPGETMRIAGFVRELDADAQLVLFGGDAGVDYTVHDPQGNEIATGSSRVNALGGFNASIDIPEEANTGFASVDFRLTGVPSVNGNRAFHQFQIQDFRTPEFEVTARTETPAPHYVVEPATVAVDAAYFAGGPLPDAEVNWLVSTTDTTYRPPNWDEYNFGIWIPWWYDFGGFDGGFFGGDVADEADFVSEEPCFDCGPFDNPRFEEFTGRTDANGSHYLRIDFTDTPPPTDDEGQPETVDQPTNVVAEATVFDVNRQAFAGRTTLLVHPAQYYVGLRSDRSFVVKGEPLLIDTTVVDVDGNVVAGRTVTVTVGRVESSYSSGRYVEELVDAETCTITSTDAVGNGSPDPAMRCEFTPEIGGQYQVTALVKDDDGRQNRAVLTQWVSGSTARPTRDVDQEQVTIVPDRETYAPGESAELLVQAPFAPASGIVTVVRAGIESTEVFDAPDGSAVLTIPIADDDVPNLRVRVDMVGASPRAADDGTPLPDAPLRPAFAVAEIDLSIPPAARTLDVVPTPAAPTTEPGAATTVTVAVADADGGPVAGAGVVLIAVDEAVLSLTGYELLDPLGIFYQDVWTNLSAELIRSSIVLADPELLDPDVSTTDVAVADGGGVDDAFADEASAEAAPTASQRSSAGGTDSAIDVRADFDALAVFAPDETTGADGTVTVAIDLPDNLTRYRLMAVAVDGADRFGSGESTLTARLPVMVRPSAPRFLNFGDTFELPVVVQNQTDAAVDVDVVVQAANLVLTADQGKRVTVPANDRVEVRFAAAAQDVGTARIRVAGVSGAHADAAAVELPVYTPATAEAFATYGVIDDAGPIAQPLLAPDGVFPQFGGLEISTSSTALQALTDAVLYLHDYRYDSADGYASRLMAVAALRDVLDAFDADGLPGASELNARVAEDIDRLQALQNGDGGFPYWQRGRESIPWVSVHATHALVLAKDAGYRVDGNVLAFALDHLRNIEEFIPADYSQKTKDAINAYALYVRDLAGERDPAKAEALYARGAESTLELDSIAQLWPSIDDTSMRSKIATTIDNAAVETAGAATFATSYGEDAYLIAHSDRRTDGIVLGALVSEAPTSDVIPKVVAGLLGNQVRGRWNNVQENSFILLALNDYFDTFESVDPDFVARAWLGETYAVEAEFRGRSTETSLTTVPMADLIQATAPADGGGVDGEPVADGTDLIVAKDGPGRLYYRLGLRYAPDDLQLDPRDEGFVVERIYEAVDDPGDVTRLADGSWQIAAGASVRVRLTMVADARRTHVALIDPLPAGLEAVNPAFATSTTFAPEDGADAARSGWWWWTWYQHQNLRDDRAEAYTSYLPGGTYEYTYIARATTPGTFVVPPTRAEEIYAPEVFGRSASDTVIVAT
ncbi:MAG: hypothetical protein HKN44_13920 [Ilumatobacter sp.]|nr:hypothetical protein [Ilumatobacter sp.]